MERNCVDFGTREAYHRRKGPAHCFPAKGVEMKKIVLIVLLALFGLLLLYVGFNRIDAKADPGLYTARDLLPDEFGYENGFYRLWTLGLDDAIDVEAPEVKEMYRRLFDPRFDNDKGLRAFDLGKYKKETIIHARLGDKLRVELKKISDIGNAPPLPLEQMLAEKEAFLRFRETQAVLLRRYEGLLASRFFQDFTRPRAESPIPNLLTWLNLARIHVMLAVVDAGDGRWREAADALLRQADFAKKAVAGSRLLITNLIGKAVLVQSLQGLAYLMNQPECPGEVFSRVLAALPPIRTEEYGSRNSLIGEFLFFHEVVDLAAKGFKLSDVIGVKGFHPAPLLQKNRTLNEYFLQLQALLRLEADPLQGDPGMALAPRKRQLGTFWWLRNGTGKILLDVSGSNLNVVVFKSLRAKSIYDMTRISAELHLRHDPSRTVQENLDSLESYHQVLDPCSGKPYIWNGTRQVLYGVGLDRVDGNGSYDPQTVRTDVVLPVILYLRAEQ